MWRERDLGSAVVAVSIGILGVASPLRAFSSEPEPSDERVVEVRVAPPMRDGLFFRAALGNGTLIREGAGRTLHDQGGIGLEAQLGWTFIPESPLHLGVALQGPVGPVGPGLMGMTFGFTHFFPSDFFVTGGLALQSLRFGELEHTDTDGGLVLRLGVGRDWWVSEHWGLGIALRGFVGRIPGGQSSHFAEHTTVAGIVFEGAATASGRDATGEMEILSGTEVGGVALSPRRSPPEQLTPLEQRLQLVEGEQLKITDGGTSHVGRLYDYGDGTVRLYADSELRVVHTRDVTGVWERGHYARAGAWILGVPATLGGSFLGVLMVGVCEGECDNAWIGGMGFALVTSAIGTVVGAAIGYLIPSWDEVYPDE